MSTTTDLLRTLFRIRVLRKLPPAGPMPKFGLMIVRDNVKMMVDTDLTEELWDWLVFMGWREVGIRNDRRHYRFAPRDACFALKKATLGGREVLHRAILRKAHRRVAVSRGLAGAQRSVGSDRESGTQRK